MDAETTQDPAIAALADSALDPLFWRPSRLGVDSAWFGHVPFAHWIVAQHRPRSIVELGAHNGVSYAAFCEAVLRERVNATALAIDTWEGDEHAGFYGDDVFADLTRFHDARYGGFSTLMRARFDQALAFVLDGSIDLLHIDGRHRYEDVTEDFTLWQPKLSPRAIVLFHDTNVRERNFGVWRLWAELRDKHPSFEFLHGHGLGVLAIGGEIEGTTAALCNLRDSAAINTVRERFATLGERWIAARELGREQQLRAKSDADLAAIRIHADQAQAAVNTLYPQYQAMLDSHRSTRANLARARYDVAARDRTLIERDTSLRETQAAEAALRTRAEAAEAALSHLRAQLSALQSSTSWRLTAPLRRIRGGPRNAMLQLPSATSAEPEPAAKSPATSHPDILFISGEDHTPGTIYRVQRYVAAARANGLHAGSSTAGPVGPTELANARMVVLWRVPYSVHIAGIIQVAREQGAIVVFDVDDLMFRPELARIDVIDGIRSQRFSEVDTQAFFRMIGQTLRASDVVTCPTEELAHEARATGRPAYVLPNGFDAESHRISRQARRDWLSTADDAIRIGYAGGSRTHQRDYAQAVPALARILAAHPQVRLTLFRDGGSGEGLVLLDEFPELAPFVSRIEWRNMVPLADLPREIARFAINIAPLEVGNPFCEAKSELKFFEAALAGVPTIASPTGPFRRAIVHGHSGLLADGEESWFEALSQLVTNPTQRARMAQAAYHTSLAHFGPEAREAAFARFLALIEGGPAGAAAFAQDRYAEVLPKAALPVIPESRVMFTHDDLGEAAITVIIPVFNYADYVPEALQSVADQTIERIDLIVIDDTSPDDSGPMVLDWMRANAARFNRMQLLRHEANAGLGFARNTGFAAAETPFVLPLDADNRLLPTACAHLLEGIGKAAFAYPIIQNFGDAADRVGTDPFSILRLQPGNYIDAMALVRKSAWAAAGGYDHVQHGWEDFDFWCRLVERGFFGINVPEALAEYRVHNRSMLRTTTEKREHRVALAKDLRRRHSWLDTSGGAAGLARAFGK